MQHNSKIVEITAEQVWGLRQEVMYPNESLEYVKLPLDFEGKHFGISLNNRIVSVVSLFVNEEQAQFRKLATSLSQQNKGYGTMLLQHTDTFCKTLSISRLWCNARIEKIQFYEKNGFTAVSKPYKKGNLFYITVEKIYSL